VSAHNFVISAAGTSTASAVWNTHGLPFVSASGNWSLVAAGNGLLELSRFYSGAFNPVAGGAVSAADLRALWTGLMGAFAEGNADATLEGGQWKVLHVSAGTFNLQRYYSAAFNTLAGGTVTGAQLDELRDLLLFRVA
jgi:hypothetical protein